MCNQRGPQKHLHFGGGGLLLRRCIINAISLATPPPELKIKTAVKATEPQQNNTNTNARNYVCKACKQPVMGSHAVIGKKHNSLLSDSSLMQTGV